MTHFSLEFLTLVSLKNKIFSVEFLGFAIPVAALIIAFSGYDQVVMLKDSKGYTNVAEQIKTGEIFEKKPISEITFSRAARTPVYPLLIVAVKFIFADEEQGLLFVHFLFALFSVVFLSLTLRIFCPPIVTGMVVVFVLLLARQYYSFMMTEWVGINIMLIFIGLIVLSLRNPSLRNLLIVGSWATVAVLTRPTMAPTLLLVPLLVLYRRRLRLAEGSLLCLTVLPIIMWMSLNQFLLGSFSMTLLGGHSLYAIGSMIGYAHEEPGDSEELKNFIRKVNETKIPKKGDEDAFVANFDETYHMMRVESNIFWVAYPLKDVETGIIPFDRDFLAVYGRRALEDNLDHYVAYVLEGVKRVFLYPIPYLTVLLLLVPLFSIYRKRNMILSFSAILMFMMHIAQGVFCASLLFVFERYLDLTLYPYFAAILLCLCALLFSEGMHARALGFLPPVVQVAVGRLLRVG